MGTRILTPAPSDAWGPLPPHAQPPRRPPILRWLERLFLIIAVVCLGYYGYVAVEAHVYQSYENRELDQILKSAPPPSAAQVAATRHHTPPAPGSIVGRIEIPRLGVSTIVRAGSDARTLKLAVGYIPGTALPGEKGNVGLAGHRDTFFRRLRDIRTGDSIRIVTRDGTFVYRVERTNVVQPSDVWVLDPTPRAVLTLVTCYPFTYVGSAPQRFIVRAALDSAHPPHLNATH